jgi:hypothetical protein
MCAFVESREQQYEVLMPFLLQGFAGSDKILVAVDPTNVADHRNRCAQAGIHLSEHEATGKAETFTFEETYLQHNEFSADRMVSLIQTNLAGSRTKGFSGVRGFGEMHWALTGLAGTEQLIEYECRVNHVLDEYNDALVCIYDITRFSGRVLLDILSTHPKVILDGKIVENEFYTPPAEFLSQYRARHNKHQAA